MDTELDDCAHPLDGLLGRGAAQAKFAEQANGHVIPGAKKSQKKKLKLTPPPEIILNGTTLPHKQVSEAKSSRPRGDEAKMQCSQERLVGRRRQAARAGRPESRTMQVLGRLTLQTTQALLPNEFLEAPFLLKPVLKEIWK